MSNRIEPFVLHPGDSLEAYAQWESPVVIVADGPYGVSGYPGDPDTPRGLGDWYEPHIQAWTDKSTSQTSLWFWNTEVGWANVHPVLEQYGWVYRGASVWNKGIGHIAGNVNTKTMRKVPVVTEMCVLYTREPTLTIMGHEILVKTWLRSEWERAGLALSKANEACGVQNAASRKYFDQGDLWYFPSGDHFEQLVRYANEYGKPEGRPYYTIDGISPLSSLNFSELRSKFDLEFGLTNVWDVPTVRGSERLKDGTKTLHSNQKPLSLMSRIITMTSDVGDVVWEPFGGTCTASVAALQTKRYPYSAEINPDYYEVARSRLQRIWDFPTLF
jgi:hypothetical protein